MHYLVAVFNKDIKSCEKIYEILLENGAHINSKNNEG